MIFRRKRGAFLVAGATQPIAKRGRGNSPTPSMLSTYTVDAEGFERRKYALRARKQTNNDEVVFDSREFLQRMFDC